MEMRRETKLHFKHFDSITISLGAPKTCIGSFEEELSSNSAQRRCFNQLQGIVFLEIAFFPATVDNHVQTGTIMRRIFCQMVILR